MPIHLTEIFTQALRICAEQVDSCRVDADDHTVFIQQNQTFPHIHNDLIEFIGLSLQLSHLTANFIMLLIDPVQKRRKFFVFFHMQAILFHQLQESLQSPLLPCIIDTI